MSGPNRVAEVVAVLVAPLVLGAAVIGYAWMGSSAFPERNDDGTVQDASMSAVVPERRGAATADHSQFDVLKEEFATGPDVTRACLTCHTEAAKQVMKTPHWTWLGPEVEESEGVRGHLRVGKASRIINNFCIALSSNEPRCTSCHAGYGWEDKSFDFTDETRVDCLICHDQTGTYKKFPTGAGHPVYKTKEWPKGSGTMWEPPDLNEIAQNVGAPTRHNCGSCHFFGGGGEGVKHGDMDVQLDSAKGLPNRALDVHMAADGADFNCTTCHTSVEHEVAGRVYDVPAYEEREFVLRGVETNLLACESCHDADPHREVNPKLDDHSDVVSCQACHIPRLAREKATKVWWDWSKAGEKIDGKGVVKKTDLKGETVQTYNFKKGEFIWAKNEIPEYIWYANRLDYSFIGDVIDDQTPGGETSPFVHGANDRIDESKPIVAINRSPAEYGEPMARIWPAKIMRGVQAYDTVNKTLVVPKLFPGKGPDKGEAYWKSFDWGRSIAAGMAYSDLEYSGEFGWIQTEMIWPLKHTVAPASAALSCNECHVRGPEGRLAALGGFYMPGRDSNVLIDVIGIILIIGAIIVSIVHGGLRLVVGRKEA